jgi:hypothetical protein
MPDHEILARRSHRLEKALGARGHLPVEQDLPVSVDDPDGPWSGHADRCHSRLRALWCRIAFAVLHFTIAVCMMSIPDGEVEEEVSIIIKR